MDHCLTINSIADFLSITPRMVRMRAKKERWYMVCQRIRGGYRYLFPCATLPDDVRAAVYTAPSNSAVAGFTRGMGVNAEILKAEQLRQQAKEAGLAAYNALPEDKRAEADARFDILQARDAFLSATHLSKKKGTLLFIKELKAGTIQLPDTVSASMPTRKGRYVLSWATLYRWETAYKEQGRAGLAGSYASPSTTTVPEHMQTFIQAMIVDHPHILIPNLMQAIQARFAGQSIPKDSAVRRYVKRWKDENASLLLYLTNPDEWKNRHMFAFRRRIGTDRATQPAVGIRLHTGGCDAHRRPAHPHRGHRRLFPPSQTFGFPHIQGRIRCRIDPTGHPGLGRE